MGTHVHIDPPFGHYALPAKQERIRAAANTKRPSRLGKWMISLARKRAIKGRAEPFDIEIVPGLKARLYPSTNRCEKRALCGVQIWDAAERDALRGAVLAATAESFVFLDVGANVGLYSLFTSLYGKQANKQLRVIAVEPSAEMGARLSVNAQVSAADIELIRCAIATKTGQVFLSDGGGNRGEGQLAESGEAVNAMTLLQLCESQGVTRIDALKLDIEGQDLAVLTQFFDQAEAGLHPHMMILELDADSAVPLIELAQANNYLISKRTRMNVVATKWDNT